MCPCDWNVLNPQPNVVKSKVHGGFVTLSFLSVVWLLQGITGIRFSGGEKCYIKTQVKARLPDVDVLNKDSVTFDLVGLYRPTSSFHFRNFTDVEALV